jgi:acyl-coenzyme A synthetase/AMP-(fatty) acid ligase
MTAPVPARFNLAKYCLSENARLRPDHIALTIVGDESVQQWTHAELELKVRQLAAGLRTIGLAPGDRIMIRMGNEANAALTYFAAIAAGYVALLASAQ